MKKCLEFYRFLRGFVIIRISGGFPERFLNLCNRERIYLLDTFYESGCFTAKIYCKDFLKLRKIRKKSGVSIKIIEKKGLIFLIRQNQRRRVIVCGIVFSLIFMSIMNLFVWCIEVNSTPNVSKEEILAVGEVSGLNFGTFVPFYDESKAGRESVNRFGGKVIWSAFNIKGSKATLEVREYDDIEADEQNNFSACNVIADFDAVIISTHVYSGVGNVVSGSAVKKGDLLISGISQNSDGSVNFHCADGKISAFRKRALNKSYVKYESLVQLTKESDNIKLNIFSLSVPLSLKSSKAEQNYMEYTEFLKINNCLLPFGITYVSRFSKNSQNVNSVNLLFYIDDFTQEEYSMLNNSSVINAQYSFSEAKDGYNIIAEYDCIDFIGKKSVILKEN